MAREIRIQLQTENCRACRRCLAADVCKARAIMRIDNDEPPYIDIERCYDCRLCISACPFGALRVMSDIRLSVITHTTIFYPQDYYPQMAQIFADFSLKFFNWRNLRHRTRMGKSADYFR